MKKALIIFALAACFLGTKAQPQHLFEEANTRYQENDFSSAIVLYDSIVAQNYAHAETFYNLGNAHYRLGNVGLSILNYEKALQLNPQDEDALHNLELANKRAVDEFNAVPTPALKRIMKDLSALLSSRAWSVLAICFFASLLLFATLYLFVRRKSVLLFLGFVALGLGLLTEGIAYARNAFDNEQYAILIAQNSYVKSAPADTAEDLFILHEGTKVNVLEHFSGWVKVKLADGKIGWMQEGGISTI